MNKWGLGILHDKHYRWEQSCSICETVVTRWWKTAKSINFCKHLKAKHYRLQLTPKQQKAAKAKRGTCQTNDNVRINWEGTALHLWLPQSVRNSQTHWDDCCHSEPFTLVADHGENTDYSEDLGRQKEHHKKFKYCISSSWVNVTTIPYGIAKSPS